VIITTGTFGGNLVKLEMSLKDKMKREFFSWSFKDWRGIW
jgi:hypothetical protein